eukprot:TRINITY_DN26411_c0_g1_i1.p2 TRINITY_DN26411_c0_g1~~TRINITY_DN26411_c0_g1_i1.p2  ORF type:complete len:133 (+),score=18.56 TRINITY_DN26411_c0_g1_i1:120-518(+)
MWKRMMWIIAKEQKKSVIAWIYIKDWRCWEMSGRRQRRSSSSTSESLYQVLSRILLDAFTHKDPTIPKIKGLLTSIYNEAVVTSAQRTALESSLLVFFLHHFQGDAAIKCLECFQPIPMYSCLLYTSDAADE